MPVTDEPPAARKIADVSPHIGVSRHRIPCTPALQTLLRTRMDELGISSYRALAEQTGDKISHGSVHRILTGQQATMHPKTLAALADALELDADEMIRLAGAESLPWTLGPAFDQVPLTARPGIEAGLMKLLQVGGVLERSD